MEINYVKASKDRELKQILALQKKNAMTFISDEEKEKEGFITVSHSFDVLKQMNNVCPHIIAKYGDNVIGYALSMDPCFGEEIPVLAPMFEILNQMELKNYLVMGQVCIDKNHRKRGIFRSLYAMMQKEYTFVYETIVTEVDSSNVRSLNAHYAIGFKLLKNHTSFGQNWNLIILPTNKKL